MLIVEAEYVRRCVISERIKMNNKMPNVYNLFHCEFVRNIQTYIYSHNITIRITNITPGLIAIQDHRSYQRFEHGTFVTGVIDPPTRMYLF